MSGKKNKAKKELNNNLGSTTAKITLDDHLKGTSVDPDTSKNIPQEGLGNLDVQVEQNTETEIEDKEDLRIIGQERIDPNHYTQPEISQRLEVTDYTGRTNIKINNFFLILMLFLIGFLIGKYYETSSRNTVYVLDEAKFLKLASIGIATSDQDKITAELSDGDRMKVKDAMVQVNKILSDQYSRYPVLIKKRNKQGYDVYNKARYIDITVPLLIQLIGKEKWLEIGKILK